MPKLRPTPEQLERRNFNYWVKENMKLNRLRQTDLGEYLDMSQGAVSNRMNGITEWSLNEMTLLCELFKDKYVVGESL